MWAVCGRAAAVIDMSASSKQTLVVEVMPLVGGHLRLPKVRISKYIPAGMADPTAPAADKSKLPYSRIRETRSMQCNPPVFLVAN